MVLLFMRMAQGGKRMSGYRRCYDIANDWNPIMKLDAPWKWTRDAVFFSTSFFNWYHMNLGDLITALEEIKHIQEELTRGLLR